MPRAPRYHVVLFALASRCCRAARPASTGAAARRSAGAPFRRQPCSATTVCSWQWMSRHSRTRRGDDEVLAQQLLVLAIATAWCSPWPPRAVLEPLPQLQVAENSRLLVVELRVRLVGRAAACSIGRSRTSCTDSALAMTSTSVERAALARLEDHAADARVERQLGQLAADRRQLVGVVDRAELVEQLVAVGDGAPRRRLEEREVLDRAQVQRLHAQDHAGQRRAQDLRVGEARPAAKSFSS